MLTRPTSWQADELTSRHWTCLSVTISVMDISMVVTYNVSSWREFTILNSPKGFWRSLPEISLFCQSYHLKTWLPNHWCPFPFHSQGWMPCNQQSNIPTVYQTHVFAKLHQQIKHWLRLNILLNSNEKERIGCNGGFCTALGADCNLSFGKWCKCLSKSEPGCWKSNLTESFDSIRRNKQTK